MYLYIIYIVYINYYRLLEKMKRSLELPKVKDSGLEDIELQEEASLGLECGNGQTDQASHLQTGVKMY